MLSLPEGKGRTLLKIRRWARSKERTLYCLVGCDDVWSGTTTTTCLWNLAHSCLSFFCSEDGGNNFLVNVAKLYSRLHGGTCTKTVLWIHTAVIASCLHSVPSFIKMASVRWEWMTRQNNALNYFLETSVNTSVVNIKFLVLVFLYCNYIWVEQRP